MRVRIPIQIINIENNGCHIVVQAKFGNHKKGLLIIDTGASKTVFDSTLVESVTKPFETDQDIQSTGIDATFVQSRLAILKKIEMGDFKSFNLLVVLIDLSNITKLYKKINNKKIWGLLGSDFLSYHKAKIDYEKNELSLKI